MASYASIVENWFYLRYLKTFASYQEFEAEPASEDRMGSRRVMRKMLDEVPNTVNRLFGIPALPLDLASLQTLDDRITPDEAERWMQNSDPDDPNNHFKLTVSEFAVHLGTLCVGALGASWRYARMPNYFQSVILAEGLEFLVFDTVMKKCSHDFGHESLRAKFHTFAELVERDRSQRKAVPL